MQFSEQIVRLYGYYEISRAPMYQELGDQCGVLAIELAHQGSYIAADSMADRAREYREAAAYLASKDAGAGI